MSGTLGYINDNLDGDVSIEAMADIAGLSPFHFSRTFARATGPSPHRYVMLARSRGRQSQLQCLAAAEIREQDARR